MAELELLERPTTDIPPGWPPEEGDGGGGGGGGGGDGEGASRPEDDERGRALTRIGTLIVMISISVIFFAFLVTYALMRLEAETWPPPGTPELPVGMWGSTLIIGLSSVTAMLAARARRQHRHAHFMVALAGTFALGLFFCGLQGVLWTELLDQGLRLSGTKFSRNFFTLTALHVAHVIGGLVYLSICLARGMAGPGRPSDEAVASCILYWHFVGGIWVVLFAALYLL
jgi:cytochrome c oxidase subunit III